MSVRVRFAPSPTGYLHIGGARTALFNYLYAKRNKGKFVLRIEDTDKERSTDESVKVILDSLKWMGVEWDEGPEKEGDYGPYFQSKRGSIYKEYLEKLVEQGKVYKCYCTKEELDAQRELAKKEKRAFKYPGTCRELKEKKEGPFTLRIKTENEGETVIKDIIRGDVVFKNPEIDDFIIARADGSPVYNFVVAVDDALMKISHVIRGEDHLSNTPKQAQVYKALGFPVPEFAHIPLILGPDKSRLSKRHGATSVGEYKKMGIMKEAFINALALLGWSYDDKTEKFTLKELEEKFDLSRVNKSGAMYDITKMLHFNGLYIRELDPDAFAEKCLPYLKKAGLVKEGGDTGYAVKVIKLEQEKVRSFSEIADTVEYFFRDMEMDEKAKKIWEKNAEHREKVLGILKEVVGSADGDREKTEKELRAKTEEAGIKPKVYMHVCRAALTGRTTGPGLFDIISTLGKDECLKRLEKYNI